VPGVAENLKVIKGGKFTEEGKKAVLQRIRNVLTKGSEGLPFPCDSGKNTKKVPADQGLPDDIEDEQKYPEFWRDIIGSYEGIANALNIQGNHSLPPPFVDPFALASKLGKYEQDPNFKLDFDILKLPTLTPATLAILMDVNPIDLLSKFALPPTDKDAIIKIPKLPPFDIKPPVLNPEINALFPLPGFEASFLLKPFADKFEYDFWKDPSIGIPKVFLSIFNTILSKPALLFKLIAPKPDLCFAIDAVVNSKMFGTTEPGAVSKSAIIQDQAAYAGSFIAVGATALAIGDGGQDGATGLLARESKIIIVNAPEPSGFESGVRPKMVNRVVKAFLGSTEHKPDDKQWGNLSLDFPGYGYPHYAVDSSYIPGVPPATGEGGGVVTSCGQLPAQCLDVMLGLGKNGVPNEKGDKKFDKNIQALAGINAADVFKTNYVDLSGRPTAKSFPAPLDRAQELIKKVQEISINEYAFPPSTKTEIERVLSIPTLTPKYVAQGPIGTLLWGKYLRAYMPSGGRDPKPGDIYFVGDTNGGITHVGIIIKVEQPPDNQSFGKIITADAGQGAAGQKGEPDKQQGAINKALEGMPGPINAGNYDAYERWLSNTNDLSALAAIYGLVYDENIDATKFFKKFPSGEINQYNPVAISVPSPQVQAEGRAQLAKLKSDPEVQKYSTRGSQQQSCYSVKDWFRGNINEPGSAWMIGDFGDGANQFANKFKTALSDQSVTANKQLIKSIQQDSGLKTVVRSINGWIDLEMAMDNINACVAVTPCDGRPPAFLEYFNSWLEAAYENMRKIKNETQAVLRPHFIFDERTKTSQFKNSNDPDKKQLGDVIRISSTDEVQARFERIKNVRAFKEVF